MRKLAPFYQFAYATQMRTPGAMAYGFESEMLCLRPMIGPAIAARLQFASLMPVSQNYQQYAVNWLAGLSGVAHGQSALQPLSNPYSS